MRHLDSCSTGVSGLFDLSFEFEWIGKRPTAGYTAFRIRIHRKIPASIPLFSFVYAGMRRRFLRFRGITKDPSTREFLMAHGPIGSSDFSRHAQKRCRQRGVRIQDARLLLEQGRREHSVRGGATSLMLGADGRDDLLAAGVPPDLVAKLGRLALVLGPSGLVATVVVPSRRQGRRYRRGMTGRRHS